MTPFAPYAASVFAAPGLCTAIRGDRRFVSQGPRVRIIHVERLPLVEPPGGQSRPGGA